MTDHVEEEAKRIAAEHVGRSASHKELIEKLQRQWIERMEFQRTAVGKKRDAQCLEFLIGAQAALNIVAPKLNITGIAFLVSVRGASALEDWTAE